jgi:hypothetical protein
MGIFCAYKTAPPCKDAQVDFPVSGFGFSYWLPPTAAVTLAVSPAK